MKANELKTISNEEKAKTLVDGLGIIYTDCNRVTIKKLLMKMAEWKDEQYKQDKSNFTNYLKEWAQGWLIEQLTAFAVHLNKRGAFRDDLCMDFEHEAQSFIELQKPKKL